MYGPRAMRILASGQLERIAFITLWPRWNAWVRHWSIVLAPEQLASSSKALPKYSSLSKNMPSRTVAVDAFAILLLLLIGVDGLSNMMPSGGDEMIEKL